MLKHHICWGSLHTAVGARGLDTPGEPGHCWGGHLLQAVLVIPYWKSSLGFSEELGSCSLLQAHNQYPKCVPHTKKALTDPDFLLTSNPSKAHRLGSYLGTPMQKPCVQTSLETKPLDCQQGPGTMKVKVMASVRLSSSKPLV